MLAELSQKIKESDPLQIRSVIVRVAIIVFFFFLAVVVAPPLGLESVVLPVLILCSLGLLSNGLSLLWILWGKWTDYRVYFATLFDILLITVAVHYMGGLESTFAWVYVVVLVSVGSLHGVRVGVYVAVVSCLMYTGLLLAEFSDLISHVDFHRIDAFYLHQDRSYLHSKLVSHYILFFVVAGISGFLSERLVRSKAELEKSKRELEERNKQLMEMQEALEGYAGNLENTVAERTSELKEANEALRESEHRYRTLVEEAKDIIITVNLKTGTISSANTYGEEILGYRREEVIDKVPFLELIHPDDQEQAMNNLQERVGSGKRHPGFPFRVRKADGSYIEVEINGAILRDGEGNPDSYLGVLRDITGRRQAERALRFTQFSIDHSADAAYWMGPDARFVYVNEAACRSLGYSQEELLSMTVHDIDPNFPPEAWPEHWMELRERGSFSFESNHRTKDGQLFPVEITVNFVQFEGEEYNCAFAHDITERKRADEELRSSEERLKILFEYAPDAYYLNDFEGRFVDGNKAAEELIGYKKEELLGKSFLELDILPPDQLLIAAENLAQNAQGNVTGPVELILNRKDGTQVTVEIRTYPVTIGDQLLALGSARDVTQQKRLQQQLFQAQKMESIGTLAGGIAHDFNNILSGILGYASFVKTKIAEDNPIFNYIGTIESSAERAADLTSQLLAFARGGKYETKPINLNGIVEDTLKILGRTLDKSIEIRTHLQPSLPTVEADAGQMQQILMNLCVNANDAMPNGGQLVIETNAKKIRKHDLGMDMEAAPGSYVALCVTDTGIGMDKETVKRIFEPFYTTKQQGKGTGLGLSMVYGVVRNHGGFVHVYSEPGMGSTFKVYLPASAKLETEKPLDIEKPLGGNELVLVVDDEASIRSMARDMLEDHGYSVLLAEDGARALEVYEQHNGSIKLVILDMVMPKMGGHETFLRLKELNPSVIALLSTGYSQNGKAREILDSGVMGFVQKPYRVNTLLSTVRSVLDANCQV